MRYWIKKCNYNDEYFLFNSAGASQLTNTINNIYSIIINKNIINIDLSII